MMLSKQAEDFLQKFDRALRVMQDEQRQDIVREVRSHFEERGATLDITRSFGTPEQYAANFVIEHRLTAALARPWPWRIVGALFATVRDAALFFIVLMVAMLELTGLVFVGCGVLKPFFPNDIGTWTTPDGRFVAIGSVQPNTAYHEVLGYWAVPLYITIGAVVFYVAHRILVGIVRWRLRLLRSRGLPAKTGSNDHSLQLG